jgi:hypothetical protein
MTHDKTSPQPPPAPETILVEWWSVPNALGISEMVKGFGGIVPPVIAGFSLTTLATLLTADHPPRLATWADVGFIVTAACLLYSMQFSFTALRHWATPQDRLDWKPDAREDGHKLFLERRAQAIDLVLFRNYTARARGWYNFGLISFTVSIVCLTVPRGSPGVWRDDRLAMFAAAAVGVIGELLLVFGSKAPKLGGWLWPEAVTIEPTVPDPVETSTTPYQHRAEPQPTAPDESSLRR